MNAAKPKLVAIKKKATNVPKQKRKRGAAKMREAADKIVGRDCKPIVEALSSNGKKGQTLSAKFLYGLAQSAEASGEGEGARKIRSIAIGTGRIRRNGRAIRSPRNQPRKRTWTRNPHRLLLASHRVFYQR